VDGRWKADPRGYFYRYAGGKKIWRHREVWEQAHGPIPGSVHVHHLNHVPGDDRLENLQAVTGSRHRKHHAEARAVSECRNCGHEFEHSTNGRPAWYCAPCKVKVAEASRVLTVHQCEQCGTGFEARSWVRFCSQRCVNLGARWPRLQPDG
jgi:predicted Zn-ribbon and HTH transcriptional regulator